MAKDYKNRGRNSASQAKTRPKANTRNRSRANTNPSLSIWRWGLALLAIVLFAGFLIWLKGANDGPHGYKTVTAPIDLPKEKPKEDKAKPVAPKVPAPVVKREPEYKFYQYLPQQEVILPEPEIKIRKREESLGKAKPGKYVLQFGSFRNLAEADKLKAQLALLGVEASIQQATVADKTWNRVRSGPYPTMTEVERIRDVLRNNSIDATVLNQSS